MPCPPVPALAIVVLFSACSESVPDNGWGFGSGADTEDNATQSGDAEASTAAPGSDGAEASDGANAEATAASDPGDGSTDPAESSDEGVEDDGGSDPGSTDDGTPGGSSDGGLDTTYDYGRCNEGCAADMCITIDGFNGSFCTTECVDGACPAPTEGDAVGQCLLGPDLMMPPVNCVLTCSIAGQNCPGEMACVDAMMGGDAGICLWQ